MRLDGDTISHDLWNTYPNLEYLPKKSSNDYLFGINEIEYSWFSWKKVDNNSISIIILKNNTKRKRNLSFQLSVGNAVQNINIVQDSI